MASKQLAEHEQLLHVASLVAEYAAGTAAVLLVAFYTVLWIVVPRILIKRNVSVQRGWLSLRRLEWTNANVQTYSRHTAKVQKVHIDRLGVILGKGSPKHTGLESYEASSALSELASLRWGWIGIGASGVRVQVALQRDATPADEANGLPLEDVPVEAVPMSKSRSASSFGSPLNGRSRSNSLSSISKQDGGKARQYTILSLLMALFHASRAFHTVRRRLRSAVIDSLPRCYRVHIARGVRICKHRLLSPLLHCLNNLSRRMNYLSALVAVEVKDVRIECPEIGAHATLESTRFGVEVVRGVGSHISAWLRIEALSAWLDDVNEPSAKKRKAERATIFKIAGPVIVEARANFDREMGLASLYHRNLDRELEPRKTIVDLCLSFPQIASYKGRRSSPSPNGRRQATSRNDHRTASQRQGSPSVDIRLDPLLAVAERVKRSVQPDLHFDPHMKPHLRSRAREGDAKQQMSRDSSDSESDTESMRYGAGDRDRFVKSSRSEYAFPFHHQVQEPIRSRQNPVAMLKSLSVCIPLIRLSSTLNGRETEPTSASPGKQTVAVYSNEAKLRGLALRCSINPAIEEGQKHAEWFGKQAQLKAAGQMGFESFDLEVTSVLHGERHGEPCKLLSLAPCAVHLSSTWLPSRFDALFASGMSGADAAHSRRVRDHQIAETRKGSHVIVEIDIGGVGGSVGIETLEDLLHLIPIRRARWRKAKLHEGHSHTSSGHEESDLPLHLYDLPVLNLAIDMGQSEYRIIGPSGEPHRTSFGPGEDDANLSVGWAAPAALTLQVPSITAYVSTQYVDLCLQRTAAERRDMRKLMVRGKVYIPDVLLGPEPRNGASTAAPGSPHLKRDDRRTLWDGLLADESDSLDHSVSPDMSSPPAKMAAQAASHRHNASAPHRRAPQRSLSEKGSYPSAFIAPHQPIAGAYNAPLAAHPLNDIDEQTHAFVYKIEAGLHIDKVQFFLWTPKAERHSNRTNPSNAGPSRKYAAQHQHTASQPSVSTPPRERRHSKPASYVQLSIAHAGPAVCTMSMEYLGSEVHQPASESSFANVFLAVTETEQRVGQLSIRLASIGVDVSRFEVHHAVNGLLTTLASVCHQRWERHDDASNAGQRPSQRRSETEESLKRPKAKPFIESALSDIFVCASIADLHVVAAGPDPLYSPATCRGLALRSDIVSAEYISQKSRVSAMQDPQKRASLGLESDIRMHANAQHTARPKLRQAFIRFSTGRVTVNPVNDTGKGPRIMEVSPNGQDGSEAVFQPETGATWEYMNRDKTAELAEEEKRNRLPSDDRKSIAHALVKGHVDIPGITARISIWAEHEQTSSEHDSPTVDHIGIRLHTGSVLARPDLFFVYCALLATATLRSLQSEASAPPGPSLRRPANLRPYRPSPVLRVEGDVDELFVYLTLPHNVRTFVKAKRFSIITSPGSTQVKLDNAIMAAASVISPGHWDDIMRLRDWQVHLVDEPGNGGYHKHAIYATGSGARVRIPFKYPMSMIIDNVATFVKAIKQLLHQFIEGKYNSAIEPRAETAKHLPKISIALKVLVMEAEDDPFETKLNLLFRVGKEEQLERLHRYRAFSDKLEELKRNEAASSAAPSVEGTTDEPTPAPKMTSAAAYQTLQRLNSVKWIQRHRNAVATKRRREEAQLRRLHGSISALTTDGKLPIRLATSRNSAPLFRLVLDNPVITLTKPSFADTSGGLCVYLHDVGKGMPRDMQYSLLIPFHLDWQMAEAKAQVRDYPLPLLHIPPVQQTHSDAKSWHLSTDFVIAEELGGADSIRHVPAEIVPRSMSGGQVAYVRNIPRTAMPIKTYSKPVINIDSAWTTRVGWGNSIQPAIQDVMRVMDSITKAPPDPSDRLGFWDKLRLILHWRIEINFVGEGPLHFILKGSRDPYSLEGEGAGFALCWRDRIRWKIGVPNDDREFFQIRSEDFVLGIPNLNDYRDAAATGIVKPKPQGDSDDRSTAANSGYSEGQHRLNRSWQDLSKVCARFGGGVRWGLGTQFERTCRSDDCDKCSGMSRDRECRFFEFRPHYTVKTISGADAKPSPTHDSYAGFRSDFIHLSISVVANSTKNSAANSLYLTPNGFSHFYAWWHLFDGTMSLPVRHGSLFPSVQPPSKKFGKHTATIKYRIQLAPVYIAHTYKQETWQDWRDGMITVLGLKGRIASFNVDLHQREQEERTWSEALKTTRKRLHKAFNRAEIDCQDIDARVIAARFYDERKAEIDIGTEEEDTDMADLLGLGEDIPDEDLPWIDLDDFRDLGLFLRDQYPQMRITPCFKSPRLTYSRYSQADVFSQAPEGDENSEGQLDGGVKPSKFGNEPTHTCLLDQTADPLEIQLQSNRKHIDALQAELRDIARPSSNATVQEVDDLRNRLQAAKGAVEKLEAYQEKRRSMKAPPDAKERQHHAGLFDDATNTAIHHAFDDFETWVNRLIIHNPKMVVSQRIRDILMRYYFSSRQGRLFDYAMTARAIKFIKGLAEGVGADGPRRNRDTFKRSQKRGREPAFNRTSSSTTQNRQPHQHEDLLEKLLNDEGCNWEFRDKSDSSSNTQSDSDSQTSDGAFDLDPQTEAASNLEDNWGVRNSFLVSLLKPQLALNSDASSSSTILISSTAVQLRVYTIVDEHHLDDPINATVMHRSFGSIDSMQAFYPHLSGWRSGGKQNVLRRLDNFVPLEVIVSDAQDTKDLDRIVPKTSVRLRYDKHNRLRLLNDVKRDRKQSVAAALRSTLDRLSVECERFSVSAIPKHYAAIYDVVTNLILYSDPAHKAKLQRVERVVLSKDFSNRQAVAANVQSQQEELRRIRRREESWLYRGLNQLSEDELDSLYALRVEELKRMDEITLVMGALQSAQDSKASSRSMGMQMDARANEVVWHMRDEHERPIVKVGVKGVAFRWLNRNDGNVANCLVISDLNALNSSPEHVFPEIISKYPTPANASPQVMRSDLFAAVLWSMLPPVGGIAMIERFEVHLHPIRLQIEQKIGKQIQEYLFSQKSRKVEGADADTQDGSLSNGRNRNTRLKAMRSTESFQSFGKHTETSSIHSNDGGSFLSPSIASSKASSGNGSRQLRRVRSNEALAPLALKADDDLDADEMRERSRLNRTFLHVEIYPTVLCLSFKGDKQTSLYDIYGLIYKSPTITYCNRIWSYGELVNSVKKDFKSSIWSQSATLIGQILTTARHKPRNAASAVQQRLLNAVGDKDRNSAEGRRKSLASPGSRSRTVSGASQLSADHKASPLRSVLSHSDDSSDEEAASFNNANENGHPAGIDSIFNDTSDTQHHANGTRSSRSLELAPSLLRKSLSRSSARD